MQIMQVAHANYWIANLLAYATICQWLSNVGESNLQEPRMPKTIQRSEGPRFAEAQNNCNCTALRKASRRASQLYDEALVSCGLRVTQLAILNQIVRMGTPAMGELARALVMDRGALAHNVKPLERDGLIETVADPADRRNRLIALTRAGRRKIAEAEHLWARAQERFEASFGAKESAALRRALAFIASDGFLEAFQRPMAG
jgi:DNA-binding MarR family transcriptional regulator